MHGCGHDGHTAMLIGAARYLAETRQFDGTAVLIFQPGEEGYAGARVMIEDGLFERFPVQCRLRHAQLRRLMRPGDHRRQCRPGDGRGGPRSRIEVNGRGGHGAHAYAWLWTPVLVAAHIITAVQSIVSRNVRPIDSAVISLCSRAGRRPRRDERDPRHRDPGRVRCAASALRCRTWSSSRLTRAVRRRCDGFRRQRDGALRAPVSGDRSTADAETRFAGCGRGSTGRATSHVRARSRAQHGGRGLFVHAADVKPGRVSAHRARARRTVSAAASLHNSRYDFNDDILPLGAALHASLVEHGHAAIPELTDIFYQGAPHELQEDPAPQWVRH
jgi:hypothetical protein